MCLLTSFALVLAFLAVPPPHAQPAPLVLDSTFGAGGRALVNFADASAATTHAFLRLPDGRLLGVGYTDHADFTNRAALARYTSDGQPDPTFGPNGDGTVTFSPLFRLQCFAAVFDAAGRIVCAGLTMESSAGSTQDAALARFTGDGIPDLTFGNGGLVEVEGNTVNEFNGLHLLPDGRLLVFGVSILNDSRFYLWRLLPDGAPDPTFNGGAPREVSTDFCFVDRDGVTALTAGGGLVVGCWRLAEGVVGAARFEPDGDPDPTLGGDGFVATPVPADNVPTAVALDGEGRLLIASRPTGAGSAGKLLRLLPDGTLDPSFGTGGVADFSFSPSVGTHNTQQIAVLPDGRLLLVGEANSGPAFLAQFTPDGQPDEAFAEGGVQPIELSEGGGTGRELLAATYDEAGRIVGLGTLSDGSRLTFGFVRLVREGTVATEPGPVPVAALTITPNPAGSRATLRFDVPTGSHVRLAVYDALGREVAVVVDGERPAGGHEATLDTSRFPAGVYLVRLTTGGLTETRRVTLLK